MLKIAVKHLLRPNHSAETTRTPCYS